MQARTDVASLEQIYTMGQEAAQNMDTGRFLIGDLGCLVETHYGKNDIGKFAEQINVDEKRVREYCTVCRFFDILPRQKFQEGHPRVCYTQMRDSMRLGDLDRALAFLALADSGDWKVERTRVELNKILDKPMPMIKKSFMADEVIKSADGVVMVKMLGSGPADLAKLIAEHRDDLDFSIQVVATYRAKTKEEVGRGKVSP